MLAHISIIAVAQALTTGLIAGFFAYLYSVKKQKYLLAWTGGWCLLTLHVIAAATEPGLGSPRPLVAVDQWLLALVVLVFFAAAQLYANGRPWTAGVVIAAALFGLWSIAFSFAKLPVPPALGIGVVCLGVAWVFWRESRQQDTCADLFMALVFLAWAPIPLLGVLYAPRRQRCASGIRRAFTCAAIVCRGRDGDGHL